MRSCVLLHACCAPCASVGLPALMNEFATVALYFYGGNIHPRSEWERRLGAVETLADCYAVELIREEYGVAEWDDRVSGLERECEGGERCEVCMRLQLEKCARTARDLEIPFLCTSLTLSPQKSPVSINLWGSEIATRYNLGWVERVWRKKGGFLKSVQESRRLSLYRQNYCGCRYSLAVKAARERTETR